MSSVDCNVCGKTLSSRYSLNSHLRIHTNELPFKCGTCDKRYATQTGLEYHIRSAHTGERPFKCETCKVTFYSKSHLNRHRKTHLSEKPYVCIFCGKDIVNLRIHLLRHIGERHLPCDHCSKEFHTSVEKKQHCVSAHRQITDTKQM